MSHDVSLEPCDYCHSEVLKPLYRAPDTDRDLTVYGCKECGLIQSLPRIDRAPRRKAAVSAGADWGNVRYGKAFRTEDNLDLLKAHVDPASIAEILDVGANRGAFCKAYAALAPKASITALEPDERVISEYADAPDIRFVPSRIEDADFGNDRFDLIYSCHTLEHLRSPAATLADHWRTLKPGGWLLLELPNLHILGAEDLVEEFFIDKHLYHYDPDTMVEQLEFLGFEIVVWPDPRDLLNITILARKSDVPGRTPSAAPDRFERNRALVGTYKATLAKNKERLRNAARAIEALSDAHDGKLAIWGGGRLFNRLVEVGGLDLGRVAAVADKHLSRLVGEVKGTRLVAPEALADVAPDIIIVMSRAFLDEITAEAANLVPGARCIDWSTLLQDSGTAGAAKAG